VKQARFQVRNGCRGIGECGHAARVAAAHRHAIFTSTKIFRLGTPAAICSVEIASMTTHSHAIRLAGTCSQQGQQRCVAMRPVAFSVWHKATTAGNQN